MLFCNKYLLNMLQQAKDFCNFNCPVISIPVDENIRNGKVRIVSVRYFNQNGCYCLK